MIKKINKQKIFNLLSRVKVWSNTTPTELREAQCCLVNGILLDLSEGVTVEPALDGHWETTLIKCVISLEMIENILKTMNNLPEWN